MSEKKKKVVVTGGAGFIGSHLSELLVKEGFDVTIIDNLSSGSLNNLSSISNDITFIEGDILDIGLLRREFKGAEFVFHQAAAVSVPESTEYPIGTNDINIRGTMNVFTAAKETGVKRVVYASSSAVYGDDPVMPKVETMEVKPLSPYARQKFAKEMYAKIFSASHGLETVGLRYFNVYGPRQAISGGYPAVIPIFISRIVQGKPITIYGDGETTRDFIYVNDIAQANLAAAFASDANGKAFNIATGKEISLNTLVKKICDIIGKKCQITHETERVGDIKRSYADISLAQNILNFQPSILFKEGLKKTIGFYSKMNDRSI
jgi:UDP-glucose 4-epimerase